MLRTFDKLVLLSVLIAFLFSNYLWFTGRYLEGIYVGIWVVANIGLGLYFKVLRIVHFVLYRYLKKLEKNN